MPAYKYTGYDDHGLKVHGEMQGNSLEEAERKVAAHDVTIISIIPTGRDQTSGSKDEGGRPRVRAKKVSDADASVVLRNLAVMAETGVPFIDALDAVIATARTPGIQASLQGVKDDIVGGRGLSAAMRAVPALFPPLVSDMIKVAEEGGKLDEALGAAATYLERAADLRKKIINAMLYPCVMLGISVLTVGVLIIFVMPKFAAMFSKMKAQVPVTTKILLALGDFVRGKPLMTVGVIVGVIVGLKLLFKLPIMKRGLFVVMLRTPVLGELLRKLALSRSFQSIATLLRANVSLMAALEHGAKVAGNPLISDALMASRTAVEHGGALSDALRDAKVFPPMLVQMVAVGERTGRLSSLLASSSAAMEEEVDGRLKAMVSIIEPIMIVLMGGIVGTITVSIIAPIYSVVENIK